LEGVVLGRMLGCSGELGNEGAGEGARVL